MSDELKNQTEDSGSPEESMTNADERTFTLPSGKQCTIVKGKGRHVKAASRISEGEMADYMFALLAQLTTIDGQKIVMEDLDDMPMDDVMKIQTVFSELNF